MSKVSVVHYVNQFFAGVGGERHADEPPQFVEGAIGPARGFQQVLGDEGRVVATVYCGDNFMAEHPEDATELVVKHTRRYSPDVVVAGPAFGAGRYGIACGQVCTAVQDRLGVPGLTAMDRENPAVELYRSRLYIVPTAASASGMAEALRRMGPLALKLARRERVGRPAEEGYLPRGLRFTETASQPAAVRAVDMLVRRLRNEVVETEWPLPSYDPAPPPPPVKDLRTATIALVTSGGIVPKGNPDRIESTFATKWLKYDISRLDDLTAETWQSVHGGYDTTYANDDPDRVLPVDVMRELAAAGTIGGLFPNAYVTVGSGATIAAAKRFGREIAEELVAGKVDGVILVAT